MEKNSSMEKNDTIGISILICTYNGAKRLPKTLEHLSKQDFEFPFEIVVVNNASKDNTSEIVVNTWNNISANSKQLQILEEPKPGKINALNLGFKTVKYKYVLICDDDNWLASDYLSKAFYIMEENPLIGALGGKGEAVFENNNYPKWFEDVKDKYAIGSQGNEGKLVTGGSLYGAGSIIRKEAYDNLLNYGFEPILTGRKKDILLSGEDNELCLALQLLGYEIHYNNSLTFKHYITSNRLTTAYFKQLSNGMIYPSFILYTYGFVLKKLSCNYLNYSFATIYLITKYTTIFIRQNMSIQNSHKRLSNFDRYKVYWLFLIHLNIFMKKWKKVENLKNIALLKSIKIQK
jgi:glycosyltransferase involved in cell wall biosynthesis